MLLSESTWDNILAICQHVEIVAAKCGNLPLASRAINMRERIQHESIGTHDTFADLFEEKMERMFK